MKLLTKFVFVLAIASCASALGEENFFATWTPSLQPCCGEVAICVPDKGTTAIEELSAIRNECGTEVEAAPGVLVSLEKGDAFLEQVMPTIQRGELKFQTLTRDGCVAVRMQIYPLMVIHTTLNYCDERISKRFDNARISLLKVVF